MIFKCRSGKTFYIGDEKEEEGENIKNFLFGTSSCQLKSVRVEIVEGNLIYLETRFQPSLRVNQKILDFDSIDENTISGSFLAVWIFVFPPLAKDVIADVWRCGSLIVDNDNMGISFSLSDIKFTISDNTAAISVRFIVREFA